MEVGTGYTMTISCKVTCNHSAAKVRKGGEEGGHGHIKFTVREGGDRRHDGGVLVFNSVIFPRNMHEDGVGQLDEAILQGRTIRVGPHILRVY